MPAPLTGFEQRGNVAPWTTRAEEDTFLAALTAYTSAITMTTIGTSVNGDPMRVLTIGTGPRTIMFAAQQHGAELAGRDAVLTTLRQWADSTDVDLVAYLAAVTVVFMPTCHPDNLTIRENANGADINRDHIALTQPETQAIHAAIRDYAPDIVVDLHEGQDVVNQAATETSDNANMDGTIAAYSSALDTAVVDAIQTAGYTWNRYPHQARGPEYLNTIASIMGRVDLLVETRRTAGDNTDAATRHAIQVLIIDTIWRWHATQVSAIGAAVEAAQSGFAANTSPLTLQSLTDTTGPVVDPIPAAYYLTPTQYSETAVHRDRFGIATEPGSYGYSVPTNQAAQTAIAYVMDPASTVSTASASLTPVTRSLNPARMIRPGARMKVRLDGRTATARWGGIGEP